MVKQKFTYPKSFIKLMKSDQIFIFRLNITSYEEINQMRNIVNCMNSNIAKKLFLDLKVYSNHKDDIQFIQEQYEKIYSNVIIVKTTGSCEYFEEILTGEKIPIWYLELDYCNYYDSKNKFRTNISCEQFDDIPPYFIAIYGVKGKYDLIIPSLRKKEFVYCDKVEYTCSDGLYDNVVSVKGYDIKDNMLDVYDYDTLNYIIQKYKELYVDYSKNNPIILWDKILKEYKELANNFLSKIHYKEKLMEKKNEFLLELKKIKRSE